MPSLAETERLLWRLITAPEGVAKALAANAEGGTMRAALARTVRGTAALGAVERLDIYANMYFFRIRDVLQEDYPAVLAVLGEVEFHNLVTDYLLRHPPAHFSLRHVGDQLPELVAEHRSLAAHPYLAELARLERALRDAFDAPDHPALPREALAAVPAESWAGLCLQLHPSVRLLCGEWAVDAVRDRLDRGEPVEPPARAATQLCVWRRDLVVYHRALDGEEFAALTLAAEGRPFGEICAAIAGATPETDVAQRIASSLASWLSGGCVASFQPAP